MKWTPEDNLCVISILLSLVAALLVIGFAMWVGYYLG